MSKATCSIDGCEDPARCRTWCNMHYHRWERTGDPLGIRTRESPPPPGPCSIDGCNEPVKVKKRGWCHKHYLRWLRYGDPLITKVLHLPMEQRFWAWVGKRGPDECWPWTGFISKRGYGQFCIDRHSSTSPHRMAYQLAVRPVPDDLELDHLCHTRDLSCPGGPGCPHRRCCNPAHLEPVTALENTRRRRPRRVA